MQVSKQQLELITFFIFEKELKNDIFVVSNLNFGDFMSS